MKGNTPGNKGVSLTAVNPSKENEPQEPLWTARMNGEESYLITKIFMGGTSRTMTNCEEVQGQSDC